MSKENFVLVHGWGMSRGAWRDVVGALTTGGMIVTPELPGHGDRAGDRVPDDTESWVEDLAGSAGGGTVVGWSLGGQLALRLALDFPAQVSRLVLIGAAASFSARSGWPWGSTGGELKDFEQQVAHSPVAGLRRFNRWQVAGSRRARPALARLDRLAAQSPPGRAGLLNGLKVLRGLDLRERLERLSIPVLALAGSEDRVLPAESVRETAARIPGARFELIPGAGHAAILSHPEEVATAIRPFLAQAAAA